jgi:MarR family transcriptional regulator, transcriptional regulator for hemolysin
MMAMSPGPRRPPIGLMLTRSARTIERAFDEAMADRGGSTSTWMILLNLRAGGTRSQRELARSIGLQAATLTHHLNAMEAGGLVTRRRDPGNRRIHLVELTPAGESQFDRLRELAGRFDVTLRDGIEADDLATFERVLGRMYANVTGQDSLAGVARPVSP